MIGMGWHKYDILSWIRVNRPQWEDDFLTDYEQAIRL